jgi:predicted transcriptional regulator
MISRFLVHLRSEFARQLDKAFEADKDPTWVLEQAIESALCLTLEDRAFRGIAQLISTGRKDNDGTVCPGAPSTFIS